MTNSPESIKAEAKVEDVIAGGGYRVVFPSGRSWWVGTSEDAELLITLINPALSLARKQALEEAREAMLGKLDRSRGKLNAGHVSYIIDFLIQKEGG